MLNLITNDPADAGDVVDELIAHPSVRPINFTGSSKVGRIIAESAGRHLKRALLELGGKAPMVVLRDADLDRASAAAHFGAFFHQGQICMSTERVTGLVADALDKGATALCGATADGPCYAPTVLTGVTPEMRLYAEESFVRW